VKAHIFICMLAYYVKWHLFEAWRPLLFGDEDQQAKQTRDPVAPAARSEAALQKTSAKRCANGGTAHSFKTLMELLGTIVRNTCCRAGDKDGAYTFSMVTPPDPTQQQALALLDGLAVGSGCIPK
jgi:hypothetical protein